jgi:Haem-degrading
MVISTRAGRQGAFMLRILDSGYLSGFVFLVSSIAIATLTTATASAGEGLIVTHRVPAALGVEAVIAAVKACAAKGHNESIVLVDAAGEPQASLRSDGAGITTLENAEHKAYTAVAFELTQT